MTSRERIDAVLNKQQVDRIPFWPKITPTYLKFQDEKWQDKSIDDIHNYIGSEYFAYVWMEAVPKSPANISTSKTQKGDTAVTEYVVDGETLIYEELTSEEVGDSHPTHHPVNTVEEVVLMTKYYDNLDFTVTDEEVKRHNDVLKNNPDKAFLFSMPASPIMQLVQYTMGIENYSYLYCDYPDEVDALTEAIHRSNLRFHELACSVSDAEYILQVENTSTTLISPDMFKKYCVRHLSEYSEIITRSGKKQVLHMCGHLKLLLPDIAKIPAIAMEAFTSPSTGNTYLADGYKQLPGKSIIGGSCASTWALNDPKQIADRILDDIKKAGGPKNLFLSSGGVIPFTATPEIIRETWDLIKTELYGSTLRQ